MDDSSFRAQSTCDCQRLSLFLLVHTRYSYPPPHVYRQITPAWSSPQGILLLPFIKESTNVLSSLAIRIDTLTGNPRKPAANEASRLILRAFNIALGDRAGQGQLGKKEAAFHLANVLFKLYFKVRDGPRRSPGEDADCGLTTKPPSAGPNPTLPHNT